MKGLGVAAWSFAVGFRGTRGGGWVYFVCGFGMNGVVSWSNSDVRARWMGGWGWVGRRGVLMMDEG